jgi:glycosyltransferase involved in cell wall biosynthesis
MKILIVSEVFYPENFIINDLAQEWQKMGHSIEVLTQYPSYPQSYVYDGYKNEGYMTEDWDGIKIHRYPFVEGYKESLKKKLSNYYTFVKEGRKIAKKIAKGFDCIFVSQTGPLTVALPAIAAGKKYGIPVAIWTLDIWPDAVYSYGVPKNGTTRYVLNRLIKYIYNNCSTIFISSNRFKDTIELYTDKQCVYTPNWLKPAEDKVSDLRLKTDKVNFTFTGNISRYQNLTNTILGFAKANIPNAVFNIVGDGSYLSQLKELVAEKQIENVVFHGRRPYEEMNDILTQSNVLVLPLMPDEGIMKTEPLKLQSYLYAGKPILGVLGGSGKEIIEDHNLGMCAQPDNIEDITNVFKQMIDFASTHSSDVKNNALELMKTRFNKEVIVKTFVDNLNSIAKTRH